MNREFRLLYQPKPVRLPRLPRWALKIWSWC
jgi:hypothetical protein